jgi:hypothetical protein
VFFSEEKNQKTFVPAHAAKWELRSNKSLLLLFFRKEDSSLNQ